jgi:formyltetrahydrofolate-dependent phosphoribosylglycinamide formyltransferase
MDNSVAVLLSGSGRTLDNLLRRLDPSITIGPVISSRENAGGISIAKQHGLPAYIVPRSAYTTSAAFSQAVNDILIPFQPGLIVLAGFLSYYDYPEAYEGKVMNIHPALIPSFCGKGYYGMHVHKAVYDKGVKITGCTVHFVDRHYDHGPIILQEACTVEDCDTPETIAQKVFGLECDAYPRAISLFFEKKLLIRGQRVLISG